MEGEGRLWLLHWLWQSGWLLGRLCRTVGDRQRIRHVGMHTCACLPGQCTHGVSRMSCRYTMQIRLELIDRVLRRSINSYH